MNYVQEMLNKINKRPKLEHFSTRRIHLIYEGDVSEKELIEQLIRYFEKHPKLFQYFNISKILPATTSYKKITNLLAVREYIDENGHKVFIMDDDYIVFIFDLDIFFDFKYGKNNKNKERVAAERRGLSNFIKTLNKQYGELNFIFAPSFPAIEYAIALGLSFDLSKVACTNSIEKETIFEYFDLVTRNRIGRNRKSFKNIFYDTGLFNFNNLINNAMDDRQNKNLPSTINDFKSYLNFHHVYELLSTNEPFTYIDNIFAIADKIIDNLTKTSG